MITRTVIVGAASALFVVSSASAASLVVLSPPTLDSITVDVPECGGDVSAPYPITWTPESGCADTTYTDGPDPSPQPLPPTGPAPEEAGSDAGQPDVGQWPASPTSEDPVESLPAPAPMAGGEPTPGPDEVAPTPDSEPAGSESDASDNAGEVSDA